MDPITQLAEDTTKRSQWINNSSAIPGSEGVSDVFDLESLSAGAEAESRYYGTYLSSEACEEESGRSATRVEKTKEVVPERGNRTGPTGVWVNLG